jgi:hypothetical protein
VVAKCDEKFVRRQSLRGQQESKAPSVGGVEEQGMATVPKRREKSCILPAAGCKRLCKLLYWQILSCYVEV